MLPERALMVPSVVSGLLSQNSNSYGGKRYCDQKIYDLKNFRHINKGFSDFKEKFLLWRHAALQ